MKPMVLCCVFLMMGLAAVANGASKKVKVFILAGQSNMEGHGQIRSLDHLGQHPKYGHLLKKLKDKKGRWVVRKDVTIAWKGKHGPLTVGWGAYEKAIGPELMFGVIMGEKYKQRVLLIKTAWGGKDVYCDFRSPSAGEPTGDEKALLDHQAKKGNKRERGFYYQKMVSEIKACLKDIRKVVPNYGRYGYEIAGMAWFQGWNDYCQMGARVENKLVGPGIIKAYPHNLSSMFQDLRKDLKAPDMPIVIGEMGVGGLSIKREHEAKNMAAFREAQKAAASFNGIKNVTFVPTAEFWDVRLQELCEIRDRNKGKFPTKELKAEYERLGGHWYCHYNGSAANYSLVGYALAEALNGMD